MIRPHLDITMHMGYISNAYPPIQWNETTSYRKMIADIREWLHNHYPEWSRARVHLAHFNGTKTHSDTIHIIRGKML